MGQANNIIDDILFSTRNNVLSLSPTSLEQVIEQTLSEIDVREPVQIVKHYDPDLPEVMVDRAQLRRVFANLTRGSHAAISGRSP